MTNPTPLSPAAQAILDAVDNVPINVDWWPEGMPDLVAAALRAAAYQVVPVPINTQTPEEHWALLGVKNRLLAIADELDE